MFLCPSIGNFMYFCDNKNDFFKCTPYVWCIGLKNFLSLIKGPNKEFVYSWVFNPVLSWGTLSLQHYTGVCIHFQQSNLKHPKHHRKNSEFLLLVKTRPGDLVMSDPFGWFLEDPWTILYHIRSHYNKLGNFGPFWIILDHFRPTLTILNHLEQL